MMKVIVVFKGLLASGKLQHGRRIYSNGGNRWNILGFNSTKRDALSSVYKIFMISTSSRACRLRALLPKATGDEEDSPPSIETTCRFVHLSIRACNLYSLLIEIISLNKALLFHRRNVHTRIIF
jgi:hypothetical protein